MTEPQPPRPDVGPELDELRLAYAQAVAQIRDLVDPLAAFRRSMALLEEIRLMDAATIDLRDQQVLRVRQDRGLSLAKLADLLSTTGGLVVGRHRIFQMVQNAEQNPPQEAEPA